MTDVEQGSVNKQGKKVLFSEILSNIPSDEVLAELFPAREYPWKAYVTRFGLEVLKLRVEGLKLDEIAERLQTTKSRVSYWSMMTKNCLHNFGPSEKVEIDIPAVQRILGMKITVTGEYTKLSELLRDMPSDEQLFELDLKRGNVNRHRHRIDHRDLYILQERAAGRTLESIGQEIGMSRERVRRQLWLIRICLIKYLRVELDVPGLYS